jgi:hypothetical protein
LDLVLKETAEDGHAIATLEESLFCDIATLHGLTLLISLVCSFVIAAQA